MRAIVFPEWRGSNRDRNFPFSDAATLANATGSTISREIFLDARIQIIGAEGVHFVKEIRADSDSVRIVISSSNEKICIGKYTPGETNDLIELVDESDRPAGVLVVDPDKVQLLFGFPASPIVFLPEQTELAAACVTPVPRIGVTAISVDGIRKSGEVWFIGGPGVMLDVTSVPQGTTREIIDNAAADPQDVGAAYVVKVNAVGDPYAKLRDCIENRLQTDAGDLIPGKLPVYKFLKTINAGENNLQGNELTGIPDKYGNFTIVPASLGEYDNPVRITQGASGIRVSVVGGVA